MSKKKEFGLPKPGEIVEEFDVEKNGRKHHVVLRYVRMSDFDQLLEFINGAVKETTFLRLNKPIPRKEEMKWMKGTVQGIRKGAKIYVAAAIDGKISGGASIDRSFGRCSHTGQIGIVLRDKYTNMGIGTRLLEAAMNEAVRIGIEVVKLSYYEDNLRAKRVYEKLGFVHVGVIPKAVKDDNRKYRSETIMYKILV